MVNWFLESFVSASLQVVLGKLTDSGIKMYESVKYVDENLKKLKRTLLIVQSEIEYAGKRQVSDRAWQDLLLDLEEVAYDADDLLDEIAIDVSTSGGNFPVIKILSSLLQRNPASRNLTDIQSKLDGMLEEIPSLVRCNDSQSLVSNKSQTSSFIDESFVFGRDKNKREIINMLVASDVTSRVSNVHVIPIVGMIGVGKTVLAKLVYNHDYQEDFDLKMWVSVTADLDVVKLTCSILEAATRCQRVSLPSLQALQTELEEIIRHKKFLLVLDDVCNEDRESWYQLVEPLKRSLKGGKLVVTTRSQAVASLVSTSKPYHLGCLTDDDCWLLVRKEALRNTDLMFDAVMEAIGRKIAEKCKGFPLTAKSVGRLLQCRTDEDEWNSVLRSKIWDLPVIKSEVVPALRSACDHLPSYLKPCFAYCSMFPQGYEFQKDKTVQMWMGEGFIIPNKKGEVVEDTGRYYFDQLFLTPFFQGEDEKYKMQNAIHDLSETVFGEKFPRMEKSDASCITTKTRHLALVCEKIPTKNVEAVYECKALKTFLLFSDCGTIIKKVPHALFLKLGRLRVLDLSSTQIEELAKSIGNLKHLRFLDLSNTLLKWLPETMKELVVLQTLRLVNCLELRCLPKSTHMLKGLQHLELGRGNQLTSMPAGIGKLTGLQTVSAFIIGSESGQIKELKDMNNIQGSLSIKHLENVKNPVEALEANLAEKKNLDKLDLQWETAVDARNDEHVLHNLMRGPHNSLKKLSLQRYGGRMLPKWVSDPLFSSLTSIFFNECKNCALLPSLGQLPKLRSLKIFGMHGLVKVDETFLGDVPRFQSLDSLEFRDMPNLESWVGLRDNDMARLRELTISECPELVTLPSLHHLQSLQELEFEGCTELSTFTEEALSSSVKSLIIADCPMLETRCGNDSGEHWMKIEHIQYIEINLQNVRAL